MQHKVPTRELLAAAPVFSLEQAVRRLAPKGGRRATVDRLKHYVKTDRVKVIARGIYAVVPAGTRPDQLVADPLLVSLAARTDAIFGHHTALELLGAAHSVWKECTAYTTQSRRPIRLRGTSVSFQSDPKGFRGAKQRTFGTRRIDHVGHLVQVTGPERTLVDGLRRPRLVGGLEELTVSAGGFSTLDLDLLVGVLKRYDAANLWAAAGWFLERYQKAFHVPAAALSRIEKQRPSSPQYLERGSRGGVLAARWNLILPAALVGAGEPNER